MSELQDPSREHVALPAPGMSLSRSAQGATILISFQVASRALTFLVNQILLRYMSPELLGVSTQLELYSISVLYFARESLRVALQRETQASPEAAGQAGKGKAAETPSGLVPATSSAGQAQAVVNLSYVAVGLGIPLAYILALLYQRNAEVSVLNAPYFHASLALYGLATFVELLAEPCFVMTQRQQLYKIRAAAESCATLSRCVLTCLIAILTNKAGKDLGVLPFAVGQMTYACALAAVYLISVWPIAAGLGFSLTPKPLLARDRSQYVLSYFSRPILTLATNLYAQSAVKHVLTQGDSLLIASLASLQDQGAYALASNYGGLVARMLFQPIEESSRNLFGSLLSSDAATATTTPGLRSSVTYLQTILHFYALLSVVALALGPSLAPLLLTLVAGSRWSATAAGDVLATYCYLIPLLALNGITEAFIASVASGADVRRQSGWMFVFSVGYAAAGYVFLRVLRLGAVGLVWANVANMAFRILWSWGFIAEYLRRNGARLDVVEVIPTTGTLAVGVGTAALLGSLRRTAVGGGVEEVVKVVLAAAASSLLILFFERRYLMHCYQSIRTGRMSRDKSK